MAILHNCAVTRHSLATFRCLSCLVPFHPTAKEISYCRKCAGYIRLHGATREFQKLEDRNND